MMVIMAIMTMMMIVIRVIRKRMMTIILESR